MTQYVYKLSEPGLYTVGFYDPNDGKWQPESDHNSRDDAAARTSFMNGGAVPLTLAQKAAPELLEACKAAKKLLEPDLIEPGRTVFWKLVDALAKARGQS